jgi:hypothetical protein
MRKYGWALLISANLFAAVLVAWMFSITQAQHPTGILTASSSSRSTPSRTDPPFETIYNVHPSVNTSHWVSWALLDRRSETMIGNENWAQPTFLMSMIKPWIAVDYLNSHPAPSQAVLDQLSAMILDSNDQVAYEYFGGQASWDRLVKTCGLTDFVPRGWSWSLAEMSARDAVRYGECLYAGKATTPEWTAWVVDKMRHVRGEGDFGPRELFAERTQVATKNGWYNWDGKWYVNCLAITDHWVMSVLQQWPYDGGDLSAGIAQADPVCNSIARQILRFES